MAGSRERRDTPLRAAPSSRSGAPRRRDAVLPARCCPAPSRVGGTACPSSRGCWRTAGSSHGLRGCGPFVLDAAQPCPSLPGVLLQLTVRGHAGATVGQPDLWGNLLPCRGATPSSRPLPAPRLHFLFRGGCRAGPGQLWTSYRVGGSRTKGTGLYLAAGGSWILAHGGVKEFPGAASQQGGRGGTGPRPRCWLTGWPKSCSGAMGPGPYSCAVQSSLAPAWPSWVLAAGKRAGISTFGGYFQVLERSRGEMRLSPRRPEKQGPALGNGGL